jgi:hypothetical protein
MRDKDVLLGVILILGSCSLIVYSLLISLEAMETMDAEFYVAPGFSVMVIGIGLLILSISLVITALRQGGGLLWLAPAKLIKIFKSKPFWQTLAVFKSFLPELRAAGVTLAIENHFHLAPAELVRLIEAIGEPMVGVCLDPVNSISKLFCPKETISLLAPLTVSVHAKDVVIRRLNTGFYITGCPLGQGLIDLPEMLDTIHDSGRNPNILVESWMDKLDDEGATLAQEQAWICQGIEYLRGLL